MPPVVLTGARLDCAVCFGLGQYMDETHVIISTLMINLTGLGRFTAFVSDSHLIAISPKRLAGSRVCTNGSRTVSVKRSLLSATMLDDGQMVPPGIHRRPIDIDTRAS